MHLRSIGVLVFVLASCGTDKSAVEKCDDLVNTLCDKGVQCLGGTQTECVQAVQQQLPCGSAKSVSASYDRCVSQINADSCSVLFPVDPQTQQPKLVLPADCMSVILARTFQPTPADDGRWTQASFLTSEQ
jgi:hypothetical protein